MELSKPDTPSDQNQTEDSRRKPSPTQPYGLGPPSPAVQERALRLYLSRPLARIAGEGAERSKAGEGAPAPSVRFAPLRLASITTEIDAPARSRHQQYP